MIATHKNSKIVLLLLLIGHPYHHHGCYHLGVWGFLVHLHCCDPHMMSFQGSPSGYSGPHLSPHPPEHKQYLQSDIANGLHFCNILIDSETCFIIDMICHTDYLLAESTILAKLPLPLLLMMARVYESDKMDKIILNNRKLIMTMAWWITLL